MTDEEFFRRLRGDAQPLRHQPDEATLARIRARIQSHLAPEPTVMQLLAMWFRPLAATAVALSLAAVIGITVANRNDATFANPSFEISVGGESYRVGQ